MSTPAELRDYFRERPELAPVLQAVERRYRQRNEVGGSIALDSEEQVRALRRLGCRRLGSGRLHLADLEAALRASRFECGVVDALEAWSGRRPVTRVEARDASDAAWARFALALTAGRTERDGDPAAIWLAEEARYLRQEWARGGEAVHEALLLAAKAGRALRPEESRPLPAFANEVASDPHALDLDRPARRYFDRLLLTLFPELDLAPPLGAEGRELLLAAAGLAPDDISSDVVAAHLDGDDPIAAAMRETGLPLTLPLMTVNGMREARARGGTVFVVENPPVFRILLARTAGLAPAERPTLVCTAGHLSLAARKLLDLLVSGGARVFYSGDFDPAGLTIARGLVRRFGDAVRLWRMDVDSHRAAVLPDARRPEPGAMRGLEPDFPALCASIAERGVAYQESLAEVLAGDLVASP